MANDELEPAAFFDLKPGQSTTFDRRVTISVSEDGQVVVGDQSDSQAVEFNYEGVASSYHCFAVRRNGGVKVFREPSIGPGSGKLSRKAVLAARR